MSHLAQLIADINAYAGDNAVNETALDGVIFAAAMDPDIRRQLLAAINELAKEAETR